MKTTSFSDMETFMRSADLPSGVIFIRLVTDGKLAGIEKLVVIR